MKLMGIIQSKSLNNVPVFCFMHAITIKDFPILDLGDQRRNQRFISIVDNIIKKPGKSIPQLSNNWYETKATYEFFKSEKFSLDKLLKAIQSYGGNSIEEQAILVIHDTSSFSYNNLEATEGLGYLAHKNGRGILCHNSIGVTTTGTPLALLNQIIWTRDLKALGKSAYRKGRPFEAKESYRWYSGMQTCNELLGDQIKKIHIADREADVYDVFFLSPTSNADLLIRACQSRKTIEGSALWQYISNLQQVNTINLTIADKTNRKPKQIKTEVRHSKVEILRPLKSDHQCESVELTAIEIKEQSTRSDAILWRLLTTMEIDSIQQVKQCIQWYTYRWLIERFHHVVKSGCEVESLQLKQASALKKAIATYSFAAFKIMQLTYESRAHPTVSCEVMLNKLEWNTLYMLQTKSPKIPKEPPTLEQAVRWIAQLGGYLNRKSDGPPGLISVWRGYQKLTESLKIYSIINEKYLGKE